MSVSRSLRLLVPAVVTATLGACSSGGGQADGGAGGTGGGTPPAVVDPMDLLSDFEQGKALVLPLGDPARNGAWYSYNDASSDCLQSPAHGESYFASTPATVAPGVSRGRALHANFNQCGSWGAGVGTDLNSPASDGGVAPIRPRTTYDLTGYSGVAFWAMASPGTDPIVRLKMVMRVSTQSIDGGTCDESLLGLNQCGDEWGVVFSLPTDGTWKAVTVKFSDPGFTQEGWGKTFAWNPEDVLGIQFQSAMYHTGLYDFWIDDIYLVR
jgi:hypothetical protein